MEKIIILALETKFPNVNLKNLMDVLNATGNAVVATELLLDIYEEPKIPERALLYKTPATFVSYDKFKEEVRYSTDSYTTKNLYFDSEEVANECVEYDASIGREYYYRKDGDFKKEFKVPTKSFSTINLREWMLGAERVESIV